MTELSPQPGQRRRLLVLGLDGLPFSLARDLCRAGLLPNLARIALTPNARAIRAELPELSPVNWTSLATAAGPGAHGVYGFTRIDPASYAMALTDADAVAAPTIFDRLGEAGLVSKVVNLPNTYPARPLRGMLVAGFVAPELSRAVHPPVLAPLLARAGYRLEADTTRGASDPDYLLAELRATLASRRAALDLLWPDLAWDLFVFVLTETDRLFHFLFPVVLTAMRPSHDAAHPLHDAVLGLLAEWDALVGAVLDRWDALPGPKEFIALADHGFAALRTEVDLNAWLRAEGFLRVPAHAPDAGRELDATGLGPDSAAFALDPGRIYLHTADRFARGAPWGAESPRARETLARIRRGLCALTWEGEPVMERVWTADELYAGPRRAFAPDLICEPRPGFDLKAKFDRAAVFGRFGRTGTHTASDVFYYRHGREGGVPDDPTPPTPAGVGAAVLEWFGLRAPYEPGAPGAPGAGPLGPVGPVDPDGPAILAP
ncbi:MAG: alkaline phosphatase family protein [Desulfovibrionaceae bacterium]|jgi:predicted AlkP superfamily phosphohydrolase/phosphomutase|nr:alkaline phosphatase family protein [Desulfovibrionaceae bacterium]